MDLLIERLVQAHRYLYYYVGAGIIPDCDFDLLYQEALRVAPPDSPARKVGGFSGEVSSRLALVTTHEGRKLLMEGTDIMLKKIKDEGRNLKPGSCESIVTLVEAKNALIKKVDEFCVLRFEKGPRTHMGASEIGEECWRKLWLKFRFADYKTHTARMHRLFNRGHREELIVKEWLEGAGVEFLSQQDNFKSCGGHFAGSSDGSILLPELTYLNALGELVAINYRKPILWECKTYKKGTDFANLFEKGVAFVNHKHFVQMSVYCKKFGFEYALYTAVCKDNDEIYYEIVVPDYSLADGCEEKAASVINSQEAPPRISNDATFYKCKWCDFADVCFGKKPIFKCCRSCQNCEACENESWVCSIHGEVPKEYIGVATECESYLLIYEA